MTIIGENGGEKLAGTNESGRVRNATEFDGLSRLPSTLTRSPGKNPPYISSIHSRLGIQVNIHLLQVKQAQ